MRSADRESLERPSTDLTTKARIRDHAITLIGQVGFAAAGVRSIAAGVGVSPALLLHHFGSKDGLRAACDEFVLDTYAAQITEIADDDSAANLLSLVERSAQLAPLAAYVLRSLVDGGDFARRMFEALVVDTELYLQRAVAVGRIRPAADERGRALLLVVTSLGTQLLAGYLSPPGTPTAELVAAASDRLTIPVLDLYTNGLFTDSEYLDAFTVRADGTATS